MKGNDMVNFSRIQLFLCFCAVAVASGQQAVPSKSADTAINGYGTANSITKFVGPHSIRNSGLFEANGTISTTESLNAGALQGTVSDSNGRGVYGLNNGADGDAVGVKGASGSTAGYGVEGVSFAPTGTGIGVLGEVQSSSGIAGVFNNVASSGSPIAAFGYITSSDGGIGVLGRAWTTTGTGIGIKGEAFTVDGVAGAFENTAGGNILVGIASGANQFRVDGTGKVFANGGYQTGGADFAESMAVAGDPTRYSAGDLLVIDSTANRRLALAQQPYSTLVAGIYSTKPGMLGSTRTVDEPVPHDEVPLAVVGIVPCKVTAENGAIQAGDLLVTSSTLGHAMKGTDRSKMLGAVVGKALEPLSSGEGTIQVLVTLQ
jgi:hypothetical protein